MADTRRILPGRQELLRAGAAYLPLPAGANGSHPSGMDEGDASVNVAVVRM
jgi:hypothetical protein